MRIWFILVTFIVVVFIVAACRRTDAQPKVPPVRLALIAGEPMAQKAADLLTVELSQKKQLQLLERAEIQRIYREQALSAANTDYLKLGQLLGADGLLVLEPTQQGTNQFLAARLVAVRPGVVLAEVQVRWPIKEATQWAKWLASDFAPLFPKLSVLAKDAIPISVLNLRSALTTTPNRSLERELTLLLIHRLTREREIFVLERRRMADALFEKEVGHVEESPFWTGRFLVDGVLDKEGFDPNRLTLNARLMSAAGGPATPIDLAGPRTNLVPLVQSLVGQILSALHRSPDTNEWRTLEEAEQYSSEAQWALRWGLKAEAQAASESAWALGKRDREVAGLRIRSYMDGVPTFTLFGKDVDEYGMPRMPDYNQIEPATRALELFVENTKQFGCTNIETDAEWLAWGFEALDLTSGLLENFHALVETQVGYEMELSRLRSCARQADALIPGSVTYVMRYAAPQSGMFRTLASTSWSEFRWGWGSLWDDKPEESLQMYGRCLEGDWRPSRLPRLVAWTWPDRQRLPALRQQLVQTICQSTNYTVRLEGLLLAAMAEPPPPKGNLEPRVQSLLDLLWEQRQRIYEGELAIMDPGPAHTSIFTRLESFLGTRHDAIVTPERVGEFKLRLRKDCLLNAPAFNYRGLAALFPLLAGQKIYSETEARELTPLLVEFQKRQKLAPPDDNLIRAVIGNMAVSLPKPVVAAKSAATLPTNAGESVAGLADEPYTVSIAPFNIPDSLVDYAGDQPLGFMAYRQGRLWSLVYRRSLGAPAGRIGPEAAFVAVDLQTGRQETILLPADYGRPYQAFEVTQDSLYAAAGNRVLRYRFKEQRWEAIEAPIQEGARVTELDRQLYLATQESILEFQPETRTTQVIASARRRPPVNQLDRVGAVGDYGYPELFHAPGGTIGAVVQNRLFTHLAGKPEWKEFEMPQFETDTEIHPVIGSDRVLLDVAGWQTRKRLLELRKDTGTLELVMEYYSSSLPRDVRADKRLGTPRWFWPRSLWFGGHFRPDGQSLWMLARPQPGESTKEGGGVTLLSFEPEFREPLGLRVRFEIKGKPYDFAFAFQIPKGVTFLPTPAGLVLADTTGVGLEGHAGYWLIPNSVLEQRLQALRPALRVKAEAERAWQQSLLARFDANKNGVLDADELALMHQEPDCLEHDRVNIDLDCNGLLDVDELRYFDIDHNGVIEKPERQAIRLFHKILAKQALANFGTNHASLTPEQWQGFIQTSGPFRSHKLRKDPQATALAGAPFEHWDRNHDGTLDLEEIAAFFEQRFSAIDLAEYGYVLVKDAQSPERIKASPAPGANSTGGLKP